MTERAFCPDCGETIDTGLEFCPACGSELTQEDRRFAAQDPDPVAEADDGPDDRLVYGAYILGAAGLVTFLWPIGLLGAVVGFLSHRQGHPDGWKAMGVAILLAAISFAVNVGLALYCLGPGQGSQLCAPFESVLPGG